MTRGHCTEEAFVGAVATASRPASSSASSDDAEEDAVGALLLKAWRSRWSCGQTYASESGSDGDAAGRIAVIVARRISCGACSAASRKLGERQHKHYMSRTAVGASVAIGHFPAPPQRFSWRRAPT